jgi:hypothetical protein
MPLFLLLYPSVALSELDPLEGAAHSSRQLEDVLQQFEAALADRLRSLKLKAQETAQPDERWYWAAPLLLDRSFHPGPTASWFAQKHLAKLWHELPTENVEEGDAHWNAHVAELENMAAGRAEALGTPPSDLARVLAEAALGSPAVASYRALKRQIGEDIDTAELGLRNAASRIGWSFRNLFNLPDSIAILRGLAPVEPYWRRVLQYCCEGGLQPMLDEYCHFLAESSGLTTKSAQRIVEGLAEGLESGLGIRPAAVGVDDVQLSKNGKSFEITTARLRSRYAMPFADARPEDESAGTGGEVTRMSKVRDAFNSPFWPFVLVSTSVGQEGLDFHPYCHSVMHWNLPSNPVDLEQREGRVHRYKGHAVRKNVAVAYGADALREPGRDPWQTAFNLAHSGRLDRTSDMIPYWVFALEDGAKIERRVPALPLSREILRMADLRRTLAVYRMVFGQPRQEDLIEYLTTRFSGPELEKICSELRVDLTPI